MKSIGKKQLEGSLCLPLMPDSLPAMKLEQVAKWLGIGKRTLERWIAKGTFPRADLSPNARIKRWWPSTIQVWIDAQGGPSVLPFVPDQSTGVENRVAIKRKGAAR